MSTTLCQPPQKDFVPWVGWVRIFAMLGVCICHACDPLNAFGASGEKLWIEIYGSLIRPCVPLFVMLTGALLLPVEESFGGMWTKRCKRLVAPFLVWTAAYATIPWLLALIGIHETTIQRVFFPFASPVHTDGLSVIRTFFLSLIQFNQYAVQLWYIYLLFGLYLFMPILSAWLRVATLRAKGCFLLLWVGSMLVFAWPMLLHGLLQIPGLDTFFGDYVTRFGINGHFATMQSFDTHPILGACDWNTFGTFHAFSGFVGYLVLGHVLKTICWSKMKTALICIPIFLLGYAIVGVGTHWVWTTPGVSWKMAEFFWWYCSLPVAVMSASAFLLIKTFCNGTFALPLVKQFTRVGFGVFCVHYIFVTGSYYIYSCLWTDIPSALLVPFAAVSGLTLAWVLMTLLYRIPKLSKLLG